MSDSNRVGLAYAAESSYGVFGSTPTLKNLRWTSESLAQDTTVTRSGEVRSDRQTEALRRSNIGVTGSLGVELSYGAYDDLLQYALLSAAWTSPATVTATTISAAASDNSLNDSGDGFISGGLTAGSWIKISGFTGNTANNGYAKIVSVAAGKIIISGKTLVDDAAGESVTILQGGRIANGTTLTTIGIEKSFADVANIFNVYRGVGINQASFQLGATALLTGTFDLLGQKEDDVTTTVGDGSNTAAPTNDTMNGAEDVVALMDNGTAVSMTNFSFAIANNLRARNVLGTLGPTGMGTGECNVTGTAQLYFADKTQYAKYKAQTVTNLSVRLVDPDGNAYIIDFPEVKYTSGRIVAGGKNQDMLVDLGWEAYRDPTENVTVRIVRFPAA